ncbi:LexA repressor [Polystyrenella longa]|uniref:LexA repressor n=1 Tax=Polystyrenella longa TaxID=2528007 RepID=A0A518CTY1_9PLAN|nr:LexA family transcriptional regulator [Polystyrenella longa]QDU82696.1 LexA repressor [Polystyrenella longa]
MTPQNRPALTERQQAILDYIADRIKREGCAPTHREIATQFGIKSPNGVNSNLKALKMKGYITTEPKISRGIHVVGQVPKLSLEFAGEVS